MELNHQSNQRIVPVIDKIENMDGVLHKLVEQNSIVVSLLEKK